MVGPLNTTAQGYWGGRWFVGPSILGLVIMIAVPAAGCCSPEGIGFGLVGAFIVAAAASLVGAYFITHNQDVDATMQRLCRELTLEFQREHVGFKLLRDMLGGKLGGNPLKAYRAIAVHHPPHNGASPLG